jgi:mono/diheme cytochrome c family protein
MALRTKRADGIDITDPVEQVSLSGWFALSILLLMISTIWAIYQEMTGLRPWKAYQAQFKAVAADHYQKKLEDAQAELSRIKASTSYQQALKEQVEAEKGFQARQGEVADLKAKQTQARQDLAQVRTDLGGIRNEYQAAVYQWEHADEAGKQKWIQEIKQREEQVNDLLGKMRSLDGQINKYAADIFAVGSASQKAQQKVSEFSAKVARYAGLLEDVQTRDIKIHQFYIPTLEHATDRCASCHVGALYPELDDIAKTLEESPVFYEEVEKYAKLFKSHPGDHLLKHPPEKFGCVSCHAGSGIALSSVTEAHGTHHHHEQPLYRSPSNAPKAFGNVAEAGCNKCHLQELEIPGAPLLSFGKQLFSEACAACHKAKGIWIGRDVLAAAQKKFSQVETSLMKAKKAEAQLKIAQEEIDTQLDEEILDDEQYDVLDKALQVKKDANRLTLLRTENQLTLATKKVADARQDVRDIGPDLRNVQTKLRPDWIKQWIMNPHAFSEKTKMPNFFLGEKRAEEVAAFLWQSASIPPESFDRKAPTDPQTIAKGKALFLDSGCLACHVGGEGPDGKPVDTRPSFGTGEDGKPIKKRSFGPDLIRTGEKARFDWLSRWIYDPHKVSPSTRMPNLRLQREQTEAIAAWLTTQRKDKVSEQTWEEVPDYLDDVDRAKRGYQVVQRFACYSCHAIQDMEQKEKLMSDRFGRIGTEVSAHGSKTLHLFDFGLIEDEVQKNMWGDDPHPNMTRFDYIAFKARNPRGFEKGRYYQGEDDASHLRMPFFNLSRDEAHAVATFVTSLVEEPVPSDYRFDPIYPRGAVSRGRNLTVSLNCISCHEMEEKRGGYLLQRYQDLNTAPPFLTGEGRRVQPEWMFHFLKSPEHLRPWLKVRMPFFNLSDREASLLSEYFQGVDDQPFPYVFQDPIRLNQEQMDQAKKIMEGQCKRCHDLGKEYNPKGQAPLMNRVKDRIKYQWILPWVLNPQRTLPHTRMPNLNLSEEQVKLVRGYIQVLNTDYTPVKGSSEVELHRAHPPAIITEN